MTPFPWHNFEIRTRLTPQQVRDALSAHLEKEMWLRITMPGPANDKRFAGSLDADGFNIHRIMGYRNSFAPISRGRIEADGRGARINVSMQMHVVVLAILIPVLMVMLSAITVLAYWPLSIAFVALVYIGALLGFWFEADKQERALREIFQAA